MKRIYLKIIITNQSFKCSLLSIVLVLCAFPAIADWQSQLGQSMRGFPSQNIAVYVREPLDTSRERSYYPFLRNVQEALIQKARDKSYTVLDSPTSAKAYLEPRFV